MCVALSTFAHKRSFTGARTQEATYTVEKERGAETLQRYRAFGLRMSESDHPQKDPQVIGDVL